jgi:hypothetical protein
MLPESLGYIGTETPDSLAASDIDQPMWIGHI